MGFGSVGLQSMLGGAGLLNPTSQALAETTVPLAPRPPMLPGKAKRVIHLFMNGGPSHVDSFDPKPELDRYAGQMLPTQNLRTERQTGAAFASPFEFKHHGQSGIEVSDLFPHVARCIDDIAVIRSMKADVPNHEPSLMLMNCGEARLVRPSVGSWVTYGLGSESDELPAFVVMSTGSGISGGAANWSSGFLPSVYTGTRFRNAGPPILNVDSPAGADDRLEAETLGLVSNLNRRTLARDGDPEIATRIASYEMAHRLQTSAPELMQLQDESPETLALYGCNPSKASFARACLIARRLVERGVRFITIYHEGWDAHTNVAGNVKNNCRATDQASAALVADLKQRGMLDETLVVWGGEFGRTPMVESSAVLGRSMGRDHHPNAFTMWLAGGGIKGGITHGKTDDLGFHIVENKVHVHDLQATILHCLGLDHERLTYRHQGRDFRLTDVHGQVVRDLLT